MDPRAPRRFNAWLAIIGAAFLLPVLVGIIRGPALGYDEAIYAQLSRALAGGPEAVGAGSYRPLGVSIAAMPIALVSDQDWAYRLLGAASGIGLVIASWWLGRSVSTSTAGILAAVAVAAAWPIQIESTTLLTDVPAAALVVVATGLTWRLVDPSRIGPREASWREIVGIAAVAAVAFYVRYGSLILLIAVAIAAGITAPSTARRSLVRVVAAAAVLLLPHAVHASVTTGVPWGIAVNAQRAAGEDAGIAALATYAGLLPTQIVGPLGAGLAVVGIVTAIGSIGGTSAPAALGRFLGIAAVGQAGALVAASHAESRYAFVPMVLLAVLGSARLVSWLATRGGDRWKAAGVATAAVALALGAFMTSTEIDRRIAVWGWTRDVADAIGSDAGSRPCGIVTSDAPIMAWYTRCAVTSYGTPPSLRSLETLEGPLRYVILRADGHHQPSSEEVGGAAFLSEPWRRFEDGTGADAAAVYRLDVPQAMSRLTSGVTSSAK